MRSISQTLTGVYRLPEWRSFFQFYCLREIRSSKQNSSTETKCKKNKFWLTCKGLKISKIHQQQWVWGSDWQRWPKESCSNEGKRVRITRTQCMASHQSWGRASCHMLKFRLHGWAFQSLFEGLQILPKVRTLKACSLSAYKIQAWNSVCGFFKALVYKTLCKTFHILLC